MVEDEITKVEEETNLKFRILDNLFKNVTTKENKIQKDAKGQNEGKCSRGHQLAFGSYGIKSLDECWITARQIEAARIAVTRYMKRQGQVWIRVFSLTNRLLKNLLK